MAGDNLYFAYGSNMFEKRIQDIRRAPSAVYLCNAQLSSHRLMFNARGVDGSGKCNVQKTGNMYDSVYGVLYQIDAYDWLTLDRSEGVDEGRYRRKSIEVMRLDNRSMAYVQTYIAAPNNIDDSLLPFDWYHALTLAGAKEHRLPKKYVWELRLAPKVRDYDEERRSSYKVLIKGSAK